MAWKNENLVPISIRIEQYVIDDFKKEAQQDMLEKSYQTLMYRVLTAWVSGTEMPPRYIPKVNPSRKKSKK